jgi:hypothetical protein
MHALKILEFHLGPLLAWVHRGRLATLFEAVAATVSGPRLTLTDIARRFAGGTALRHRVKRADRLLGNVHLQAEARAIYGALGRMLLAGVAEPLIVIDWSDLKRDQSLHLLRASLPVGGRSLTLYEEVHPQDRLGNREVQHRFLRRLATLLPATADPIIVADSGFKVPFYREVERLGWRWLGRVRGRDGVELKQRWYSCKQLFERATQTPIALGIGQWVRSNPLRACFVLVLPKPRRGVRTRRRPASARAPRQAGNPPAARASRGCWWPRRGLPTGRRSGW